MKKLFAVIAMTGAMIFGTASVCFAQDEATEESTEQVVDEAPAAEAVQATPAAAQAAAPEAAQVQEEQAFHKVIKQKFIEGGAFFMFIVCIALILGLALSIERIIYLSLSSVDSKKLLESVEGALDNGDVEGAKTICRNTRGPIASIFYQGLCRIDKGADVVEKSVVSYGGVQMGLLEKNVTWISLCVALAPSLGFLGTIIGMIEAFDRIQAAGDISATVVAGGIKVALLTTLVGLIVAMVLQVFMNFILTRIEALTSEMEDASISLIDAVVAYEEKFKGFNSSSSASSSVAISNESAIENA
ncbi:MAG: MotA/TolQ/ExbB proton channel family protein [Paludibacteraceae bacterium]|nr:MotA/TolQ/ExbB proton channel family protein [Paludibacteraceae bacterium]